MRACDWKALAQKLVVHLHLLLGLRSSRNIVVLVFEGQLWARALSFMSLRLVCNLVDVLVIVRDLHPGLRGSVPEGASAVEVDHVVDEVVGGAAKVVPALELSEKARIARAGTAGR